MRNHIMTDQQVLRYLELVDKLLWINLHSGVDWKPEYEVESERIRRELYGLRELVEKERRIRDANEKSVD